MDIDAKAESSFELNNFHEEKLQVINFFLGLLYHLPVKNPKIAAEQFWTVLDKNPDLKQRNFLRKEIIFKLTGLGKENDVHKICSELNNMFRKLGVRPSFQAVTKDNEIIIETFDVEILKPRTAAFKINKEEKIVFGAAPEFIKTFLAHGETIPEYIILSKETFRMGLNFAEIEFSIYKNYFFQAGRRVKVICSPEQEEQLRKVLGVTLLGPDYPRMYKAETNRDKIRDYRKLEMFRDLLIPKDKDGNIVNIDQYVKFIHFINNTASITLSDGNIIFISYSDRRQEAFTIKNQDNDIIGYVDLSTIQKEEFSFPVQRTPLARDEFGVFVLDSGDGFSPNKHTSSFVLWLEGRPLLVDPMAYSDQYLKRKGIDSGEITDIFISHNHGDHDQGVYNYLANERRIRIIASEVVIQQTLIKVAAAINKSVGELLKFVDAVPIPVDKEMILPGYRNITIELMYSLHPIPTTMVKFRYKDKKNNTLKTLGYSADTILDKERFSKWIADGKLEQQYVDSLLTFFNDADIIIHEAGGGIIHSDMEKVANHYKGKKIYWVHTEKETADFGEKVLQSGDQLTLIEEQIDKKTEWYLKIFEKVPLLANLTGNERVELAGMAANHNEIEVVTYIAGEKIIDQGDEPRDKSFYIIAQGSVDILQNSQHVASLGVGQQVGEMALFGNNEGRRNATVRAFTGVKLIKINESAYKKFLMKISNAYSHYKEARPILDASHSPFKGLNHNILDNIAARMDKRVYEVDDTGKRDVLIVKGEQHNDVLYLIVEGEVGAVVDKDKGVGFKLGKGAVVGEMSMLDDNLLPTATVIPISNRVVVYTLSRKALSEILEKFPAVRYILEGVANRRKEINRSYTEGSVFT